MESRGRLFFGLVIGSVAAAGLLFWLVSLHFANQAALISKVPEKSVHSTQVQESDSRSADEEDEPEITSTNSEQSVTPVSTIKLSAPTGASKDFAFSTNGKSEEGYLLVWSRVDRTGYNEAKQEYPASDPFWKFYDGKSAVGFTYSDAPERGTIDVSSHTEYLKNGEYRLHICLNKDGVCGLRSNVIIYKF